MAPDAVTEMVTRGHELGNHLCEDEPAHHYDEEEFLECLHEAQSKIDYFSKGVSTTAPVAQANKAEVGRRNEPTIEGKRGGGMCGLSEEWDLGVTGSLWALGNWLGGVEEVEAESEARATESIEALTPTPNLKSEPILNDEKPKSGEGRIRSGSLSDELMALQEAGITRMPSPSSHYVKWFRPPCGRMNQQMVDNLRRLGYKIAMGDVFGLDTHIRDSQYIAQHHADTARSGSILVFHMPQTDFREYILEALRLCLPLLKAKGLRCVSLSELYLKAAPQRIARKSSVAGLDGRTSQQTGVNVNANSLRG